MKKTLLMLITGSLVFMGGIMYGVQKQKTEMPAAATVTPKTPEQEKAEIVTFIVTTMEMEPRVKFSGAMKAVKAEKIANVVMKYLPTQDAREQYVCMLKKESNFDNSARSPVGAVGIGQIMPPTFKDTMSKLGIGIAADDITNEDINLMVGAFYYNELVNQQNGNIRLGTIAYNGGSRTAQTFKKMTSINAESANYALHTDHIRESVKATIDSAKVD